MRGVEIVFTKDFATKKKDDVLKCDSMLASQLVHKDKVAKYKKDVKKKKSSDK